MPAGEGRDLRIDFFRGLALVMIFINHVPGNIFEVLTSRNFGLSDATEIFVFLAGYAAALAYGRGIAERGLLQGGWRPLLRAGQLYRAHILSTVAAIVVVAFAAWRVADPAYYEWINLAPIFFNTGPALVGLFTLGHQPGYFNILPLYMALLLMMPVLFGLLLRSPAAMLLVSGSIYVVANLLRLNLPHYPTTDEWFLNPLAWQFLFAIGLTLGWRAKRGLPTVPLRPWAAGAAAIFLLICLAAVLADRQNLSVTGPFAFLLVPDKTYLSVPRLLHFLALAYVAAALTVGARWVGGMLARPFIVMGQQALAVFCVGSVLAIMAQVVRFEAGGGAFVDSLLIGCGILAQFLVAEYLAWRKTTARRVLPSAVAVR